MTGWQSLSTAERSAVTQTAQRKIPDGIVGALSSTSGNTRTFSAASRRSSARDDTWTAAGTVAVQRDRPLAAS